MEQNCVKMYGAKAKGLLVKEISKVNGIVSQKKLSLLIKSIKSEGQMKSFQSNVSTLMGGGGHICLFLQVR